MNNIQVLLKGFKGCDEVLVAMSQGLVLIDEGIGFFLQGFKGGRLAIMGREKSLSIDSLHKRRGVFSHPGVFRRREGFRAAGLKWGSKRVPFAPTSSSLSI